VGKRKFWGARDEAEMMTRALEQSLSDRISNKICESLKSLLSAVHKKARPRDGHMGVSIIMRETDVLISLRFVVVSMLNKKFTTPDAAEDATFDFLIKLSLADHLGYCLI